MINNRVIRIIILLSIINTSGVFAEVPVIEIRTEYVSDFNPSGGIAYLRNDRIYSWGHDIGPGVYDIKNESLIKYDPYLEMNRVLGEQEDFLIVNRTKPDSVMKPKEIYLYDPVNNSYLDFPYTDTIDWRIVNVNHYVGSQYFITVIDRESYDTDLIDVSGQIGSLNIGTFFCDITDDKQNFLYISSGEINIYNLNKKNGSTVYDYRRFNSHFNEYDIPEIQFINNEYLMYRPSSLYSVYSVCDIEGHEVLRIAYANENNNYKNGFSKIRDSEYGYFFPENNLVRTIGEREALEDFGIIFRQTTGTANDNRVRVRDLPLTDYGKHLGFLSNGDELEILDRGGLKIQIDDMNDYWYKVRRTTDGLEGWSYGAFIDVDDPPPREDTDEPRLYRILDSDPTEVRSYK